MMRIACFALSLCMLLFIFCQTDKSPTSMDISSDGGQTGPETPVEYVSSPQTHIAWPTLAQSPCPIANYNPQRVARSLYTGPQYGRVKWTFFTEGKATYAPVVDNNGTVYITSTGPVESLFALDSKGNLLWTFSPENYRFATSAIILQNGNIVLPAVNPQEKGRLFILDPQGNCIYKKELPVNLVSRGGNIDLNGNLYFTGADNKLYSFTATGNVRWSVGCAERFDTYSYPSLSPNSETIYMQTMENVFYAIRCDDGSILWKRQSAETHTAPVIDNAGNIYILTDTGACVYTPEGTIKWQSKLRTIRKAFVPHTWTIGEMTIGYNGDIYCFHIKLYCLDNIGQRRWNKYFPYGLDEPPVTVASDSTIYIVSGNHLYRMDQQGNILFNCRADECDQAYAGSLVCDKIAYIVTQIGRLVAIE